MASLRDDALACFTAALAAVDPQRAVQAALHRHGTTLRLPAGELEIRGRVVVVALGKAAAAMAQAAEQSLGDAISGGIVVTKYGHGRPLARLRLRESGHPVPDAAGEAAAAEVEGVVAGLRPEDLVLCLLSGGASALVPAPRPPLTLADKQAVARLLLASGADIHEVNTVRKKCSRLKGGGLARACQPAQLLTYAISDVPGDDWGVIGSGPTSPDDSRFRDAWAVIERYHLVERLPPAVRRLLEQGCAGAIPDTPTRDDPCFARAQRQLLATNSDALRGAAHAAQQRGFRVVAAPNLTGEAAEAGRAFAAAVRAQRGGQPVCVLAGGETTVTLGDHPGRGGRNQEFALAAAIALADCPGAVVLAGGTDGTDGPTDAAGGLVDGGTVARARQAGLDAAAHCRAHDAYPLLETAGDLLRTGPTGTNVMDVAIGLIAPA